MAAFGCPVLEKFGCHPKIFGGEIQPDRQSGDCARRNSFFSLISVRMAATELHLTGIAEVAAVKVFEGEEKKPELLAADAAGPLKKERYPSSGTPIDPGEGVTEGRVCRLRRLSRDLARLNLAKPSRFKPD